MNDAAVVVGALAVLLIAIEVVAITTGGSRQAKIAPALSIVAVGAA